MNREDIFKCHGAAAMNHTISATAISNQSSGNDLMAVRVTVSSHGYLADSVVMLQGLTNYDGMRRLHAVATNTFDILVPDVGYVAETPGGTELVYPGVTYDCDWIFSGFELHLSAAAATASEELTVDVDAAEGSEFDVNIYTKDMNTVKDIIYRPEVPILLCAKDIVKFTWANADGNTWGLKIFSRRNG